MPDVNAVIIAGYLTREPSFRKTTNGTPVANFWIASSRKFKDNTGQWRENVCYVGVVAWYKLAETCSVNLQKGSAVLIEGELQSRSLRGEDGRNRNIVEIKASRVQFLNKREEAAMEGAEPPSTESLESAPAQVKEKIEPPREEAEENTPLKGKFDFGYQELEL
jgi:single-strand DNA-binding protein